MKQTLGKIKKRKKKLTNKQMTGNIVVWPLLPAEMRYVPFLCQYCTTLPYLQTALHTDAGL
jgi:hypothetical protein